MTGGNPLDCAVMNPKREERNHIKERGSEKKESGREGEKKERMRERVEGWREGGSGHKCQTLIYAHIK